MSLQSMQLLGSNAYVMSLYNFKYTEQQIKSSLRGKFPGETTADINAAYRESFRGITAAQRYDLEDPDFPVTPDLIPSGGGPGGCFRFHVYGDVYDPAKNEHHATTLPVDVDYIPSVEELDSILKEAAEQRYKTGPGGRGPYRNIDNPSFTPIETLLIETC